MTDLPLSLQQPLPRREAMTGSLGRVWAGQALRVPGLSLWDTRSQDEAVLLRPWAPGAKALGGGVRR